MKNEQYRIKLINGISNEWVNTGEFEMKHIIEINKFTVQNKPLNKDKIIILTALLNEYKKSTDFTFALDEVKTSGRDQELLLSKEENEKSEQEDDGTDSYVEKRVLQRLKYQGLEMEFESELFELLEKNVNRIKFVKDNVYARDLLFVTIKKVDGYENNVSLSLNTDANMNRTFSENLQISRNGIITGELVIINELKKFFEENERLLFVYIGFSESLQLNVDSLEEAANMEMKTEVEVLKYERKNKQFPDWYKNAAKLPEEIKVVPKAVEDYVNLFLKETERFRLKEVLKKYNKEEILEKLENK
jgi:hypothetical protein